MINRIIVIFLLSSFLSNCIAKKTIMKAYPSALKNMSSDNSVTSQIIFDQRYNEFDNRKVIIYGYINKEQSIYYIFPKFEDPILEDDFLKKTETIILYLNYDSKKLLQLDTCKADKNLIEMHGVFHVQKNSSNEVDNLYMTDIDSIYDFDTRSINEGGTGKKILCYSQNIR